VHRRDELWCRILRPPLKPAREVVRPVHELLRPDGAPPLGRAETVPPLDGMPVPLALDDDALAAIAAELWPTLLRRLHLFRIQGLTYWRKPGARLHATREGRL
jgi:hypothetical protein